MMPKYRVVAIRETTYEVVADDGQHAIDEMIEGAAAETHHETQSLSAVPICPTCGEDLLPKTTRRVIVDDDLAIDEATYCDACDREVA